MTIGAEIVGRMVLSMPQDVADIGSGGQRPLGGALNDGAIGQRIRERHADLEDVGAGRSSRLMISADRDRSGSPAVT